MSLVNRDLEALADSLKGVELSRSGYIAYDPPLQIGRHKVKAMQRNDDDRIAILFGSGSSWTAYRVFDTPSDLFNHFFPRKMNTKLGKILYK